MPDIARNYTETEVEILLIDTSDLANVKANVLEIYFPYVIRGNKLKKAVSVMPECKGKTYKIQNVNYVKANYSMSTDEFREKAKRTVIE